MSGLDPKTVTVADVVVERPAAARLFEQLGIDYCCGGRRTLAEACARRGLDASTVAVLLDASRDTGGAVIAEERHDLRGASLAELCDHVVAAHHERLRRELPAIAELVATVVRVHGREHGDLHDLQRLFVGLRADLDEHMAVEERDVFPALRRMDAGAAADPAALALLEHDHDATGDALCALRELCGGYDEQRALCGTHRRLLHALHAFESDLHQHVHEENNLLFPAARAGATAAAG